MVEENLAKAAEKLAAQLTGRWSEELRRGLAEELQPVLAAELRNAGDDAMLAFASSLTRLLQAPNQMEILNVLLDVTQDVRAARRPSGAARRLLCRLAVARNS